MRTLIQNHRANGVLEDELLLIVGVEHDGILVEGTNAPGEFHSAQQIDRDGSFFFTRGVEERILNVLLRRLSIHERRSPFAQPRGRPCLQKQNRLKTRAESTPLRYVRRLEFSTVETGTKKALPPTRVAVYSARALAHGGTRCSQ